MYLPASKLAKWREENKPKHCPILEDRKTDWVVDHDHRTGMVRGVISRVGNSLIGKIENFLKSRAGADEKDFPKILRNIADYLERKDTDVLHPVGLTQLTKRYINNFNAQEQRNILLDLGAGDDEIALCSNAKHRAALFRNLTKLKHK